LETQRLGALALRGAPRQWTRLQKAYLSGVLDSESRETLLTDKQLRLDVEDRYHKKVGDCYIFMDEFFDCIPIANSMAEIGNPVTTVADFYPDFIFYCDGWSNNLKTSWKKLHAFKG
jgi:hypothetical protein